MISTALRPLGGISSGRMPHTRATCSRAAGSSMLARKLIALLSRLAPALPVTLPRDHGAARALAADVASRQAKIDDRLAALDPVRVVLDAAGVQRDGALGLAEPVRSPLDGVR